MFRMVDRSSQTGLSFGGKKSLSSVERPAAGGLLIRSIAVPCYMVRFQTMRSRVENWNPHECDKRK